MAVGTGDGQVSIRDGLNFKEIKRWKAHKGRTTTLSFSPDGKQLVSGGEDALGKVWEASAGKEIAKLSGHKSALSSAAECGPDGRRIVTGGIDQKVHLWNAGHGRNARMGARSARKDFLSNNRSARAVRLNWAVRRHR